MNPTFSPLIEFYDEPGAPTADPAPPSFHATLAEDLRNDPSITKYQSIEELARGHVSQAKMLGDRDPSKYVEIPGPDNADGVVGVLRRLGASEDASAYALTPVEGLLPDLAPDSPMGKMLSAAAHKHNLLPKQAQGLYADLAAELNKTLTEGDEADKATRAEGQTTLKNEWGPAYDQNVQITQFGRDKVAELAGIDPKAFAEVFDRHGLADDPMFAKVFHKVGRMLAEDASAPGAGDNKFGSIMAPGEAQARGSELQRQALATNDIHEQRRLSAEAAKYFKMAYPEGV